MPTRRYTPPVQFVTPDGQFPNGPFQPGTPGYALTTAALATNLRAALNTSGLSLRAAARAANVSHATLINILAGTVVPDLGTITALEHAFNTPLWPTHQPD